MKLFLLGTILSFLATDFLYSKATDTKGLAELAKQSYRYGCDQAGGHDCFTKAGAYKLNLEMVLGVFK